MPGTNGHERMSLFLVVVMRGEKYREISDHENDRPREKEKQKKILDLLSDHAWKLDLVRYFAIF